MPGLVVQFPWSHKCNGRDNLSFLLNFQKSGLKKFFLSLADLTDQNNHMPCFRCMVWLFFGSPLGKRTSYLVLFLVFLY